MESEKAEEEAKKERYRLEVEASLPPEPPEGSGDSMTKIRFRLPKGENLERRFTTDTKLKVTFKNWYNKHTSTYFYFFCRFY